MSHFSKQVILALALAVGGGLVSLPGISLDQGTAELLATRYHARQRTSQFFQRAGAKRGNTRVPSRRTSPARTFGASSDAFVNQPALG